jgi:hypothetical protein
MTVIGSTVQDFTTSSWHKAIVHKDLFQLRYVPRIFLVKDRDGIGGEHAPVTEE